MTQVLILMLSFLLQATSPLDLGNPYTIGDKVEDFKLKSVDGNMYSLADAKAENGYIVVFTCNHCPYAVMYEDRMNELHKFAQENGFALLAINPNDPMKVPEDGYKEMQVRAKEKGFKFPYLVDEGQRVYPKWGATKTPHAYVLDRDMVIQYIGAIDDSPRDASAATINYVEAAAGAILHGERPAIQTTKAIGCSIKTMKK